MSRKMKNSFAQFGGSSNNTLEGGTGHDRMIDWSKERIVRFPEKEGAIIRKCLPVLHG
jgi:hypothetical protein